MTTAAAPPPSARPRSYGRWRALSLLGVHVLIGLHIAHWAVAGRSLAPLEFNEVVYTLELGLVTAGFLLMASAVLATAIVGRFFCGWACHLLALQDGCAWLLGRFGLVAKPVRSRVLRIAPWVVMGYMFLWPQVVRLVEGRPLPPLHTAGPDEAWASFVTDQFWRNLPGPWITGATFLVCGGVIVWMLGSRAFCQSACPYGAVFAAADRLAPGRIRLRGACTDCGRCTAACQSGIWVHEEVQRFGNVVDPACLRDLDCVAACPEGALSFGFGRPSGWSSWVRAGRRRRGFHWQPVDDLVAAAVMLATILACRGLYESVPFLLAVGLGCVAAALAVLALQLRRAPDCRWRGLRLRSNGRLTGTGVAAVAILLAAALLLGHSGFVRWHEWRGAVAFAAARAALAAGGDGDAARVAVADALAHHVVVEQWGLCNPPAHDRRLVSLHAATGDAASALPHLQRLVAGDAADHDARVRLATALAALGRFDQCAAQLDELALQAAAGSVPPAVREAAARFADQCAERLRRNGRAEAALALQRCAQKLLGGPPR